MAQLGNQDQVLAAGEHLVHRGELAGQADRFAHLAGFAATSKPSTVAVPASGLSSVERIRTSVVLPAPLEPSSAKMLPA